MISAKKLIYDVERKLNSLNSGAAHDVMVVDIVSSLNDAYQIIVENSIKAAEVNSYFRDNLRKLEVKNKELDFKKVGNNYFAKYPTDLYRRLNQVVVASCDACPSQKTIIPRIVQSDDLREALKNPYRQANFAWEQLPFDEAGDGIYLYTDNKYTIDKVTIDYYRKINRIEAPSLLECADNQYLNYDGVLITKDVDFDLDNTYIERKVTDVAVLLLRTDLKDGEAFNLKLRQIFETEKIY